MDDRAIKILVLADGCSWHTERWCQYLESEGFETALYSLEPCTINAPGKTFSGHRFTGKGKIDYFLAAKEYRRILESYRPDLVNPHFVTSYGWLASRFKRCPIIATAWGSDILVLPHQSKTYRNRVARALRAADYCTVDNDNLRDAVAEFIPGSRIITIIMGVDREDLKRFPKTEFNLTGRLRIIAPRGLQEIYDPETIMRAAELLKERLDYELVMTGEGKAAAGFSRKIRKAELAERVRLVSRTEHNQFMHQLGKFDVYLSASFSDSTSVALLEAMAVGLFPVVSNITGNCQWIEDGQNGLLFETGSAEALAAALIKAAELRSRFEEVATTNRKRVEADAIWQENMQKLKDLALELVGR